MITETGMTKSSSLRTNFSEKQLRIYELSISEFKSKTGSDRLYIINEAYDGNNNKLKNTMALHDKECGDLSKFWRIFDAKKATK